MLNYRHTHQRSEIVSFIRRSRKEEALLWQPSHHGEKRKQPVNDLMISESRGIIRFYFDTLETPLNLADQIYVKLPYQDSIFKTYVAKSSYESIEVKIPSTLMAPELRKIARTRFTLEDNKKVYMGYFSEVMSMAVQTVGVTCLDISRHGLGIYVSEKNKKNFAPGDHVYLERLGDDKLTTRLPCEIIYNNPQKIEVKDKQIRVSKVGIAILDPIPEQAIQKFIFD